MTQQRSKQEQANTSKCSGNRLDGAGCQAPPLRGESWCWTHHPERTSDRAEARSRGGRNKARVVRLGRLMPPRLLSVFDRLEEALQEVQDGTLDPKRANAMAAVAGAMVRVLLAGEVEERVRQLEGSLEESAKHQEAQQREEASA